MGNNIVVHFFTQVIKSNVLNIFVTSLLFMLILFSALLSRYQDVKNISCTSDLVVYNGEYKFDGEIFYDFVRENGSVTILGKVYDMNANTYVGEVFRRANVEVLIEEHSVLITSKKLVTDPGDILSSDVSLKLLPTYLSHVGASASYEFLKQLNGGYVILSGDRPMMFCNSSA